MAVSVRWFNHHGFNPHTHEGCDMTNKALLRLIGVSIHTPTKGVAFLRSKTALCAVVSIHTPTKGVTEISYNNLTLMMFQSTHPRRV